MNGPRPGRRTGISWTRGRTRSSTRSPTVISDSPTSLTRMPRMPTGGTFGGMWPLTRKRSPIWSCTGAERRSPPPCCRGTGGSRWKARRSPLKARCWRRAFPSPMAGRCSRRRKSNAPSCPWRCTSPIMWTPPPAFSARSGYLTRMVRLSRANGALSQIKPTIAV